MLRDEPRQTCVYIGHRWRANSRAQTAAIVQRGREARKSFRGEGGTGLGEQRRTSWHNFHCDFHVYRWILLKFALMYRGIQFSISFLAIWFDRVWDTLLIFSFFFSHRFETLFKIFRSFRLFQSRKMLFSKVTLEKYFPTNIYTHIYIHIYA